MTSYLDMKPVKEFRQGETSVEHDGGNKFWHLADDKDAGRLLSDTGKNLEQQATPRHQANLINARLYGNFDIIGFGARQYEQMTLSSSVLGGSVNRLSYSVVSTCVDTLNAKIGKNKPRPTFLTSGGSWKMQQKAKALTKFTSGLFYETEVHEVMKQVRQDCYIFGTGALYVYKDRKGRLCAERAFVDELYVDSADGVYGQPKQLLRKRRVDRLTLLKHYGKNPELERAIMQAKSGADDSPLHSTTDLLEVWEGWRLPTYEGAGDGRHVMAVGDTTLCDEKWEIDCFPFIFRRYRLRSLGFWGQGIAEILTGIQVSINRVLRSIDEQIRRKGKGRIYYPMNSIDPNHLDNSIAAAIPYKGGVPPTVDNNGAVSADEFNFLNQQYERAFQEVGLSQLSAQSRKPAGLDAAVALREFNDIESERFVLEGQADERAYMEFAELALELIRAEGGKGYKVKMPNKQYVLELDWKDIDMKRDSYILQMFPVSSLPATPSARLQRVEELRAGGYIDMPTAKRLLDFPDIDAEMNLANAASNDVDACIAMILDDETPKMPAIEPYQSLDMILDRATSAYLYAKHHKAEPERLDMLRSYINAALSKKSALMESAANNEANPNTPPPMAPELPSGAPSVTNNVNVPAPGPAPVSPPVVA